MPIPLSTNCLANNVVDPYNSPSLLHWMLESNQPRRGFGDLTDTLSVSSILLSWGDSNPRPSVYQTDATNQLSYMTIIKHS